MPTVTHTFVPGFPWISDRSSALSRRKKSGGSAADPRHGTQRLVPRLRTPDLSAAAGSGGVSLRERRGVRDPGAW